MEKEGSLEIASSCLMISLELMEGLSVLVGW